jgi:hypothetical protein
MTEISVEIAPAGDVQILVTNTREDLRDDFRYFVSQARNTEPDLLESGFLHQRFLRAALLSIFAYAEAVVNGWLRSLLDDERFATAKGRALDSKIRTIHDLLTTQPLKPNVGDARRMRNLLVHFTTEHEKEVFGRLSLALVEGAASELERWMSEIEVGLGLSRHPDSKELIRDLTSALGTVVKEAKSGGDK